MQALDSIPSHQLLSRKNQVATWAKQAARVVTALAVSPDRTVIAGGTDDGYLVLWNSVTGEVMHSLTAHRDYIEAVTFSPDGASLATSGDDNVTCVWNVMTGERIHTLNRQLRVNYLAFDPSTLLLVGTTFDSVVYWDATKGAQVDRRTLGNSSVYTTSMSPDGTLAIGLLDDTVVVIGKDQTSHSFKAGDLVQCCAVSEELLITLERYKNRNRLVRWRQVDHTFARSDVAAPQEPYEPVIVADNGPAATIAFATSNDEIVLLSLDEDSTPRICGTDADSISALATSPDATMLVSASAAGTVHVRELSTGKVVLRLVPQVHVRQ